MTTTRQFLETVITCEEPGYFCLALSNGSGGWLEEWYRWPDDCDRIIEKASKQAEHANVYFSTYLFKAPQSVKENVLPSRTIQADLDDADIKALPVEPTVLVETSPGRHQGYWVLAKPSDDTPPLSLDEHELLSRKLTYSIELCDRSGWPLGRKVRLPGTFNHKYLSGPKPVKVLTLTNRTAKPEALEALPEVPKFLIEHFDDDFVEGASNLDASDKTARELLKRIEADTPTKVWLTFDNRAEDRSEALWALMVWAFKNGLSREEVFTLAKASANNKFRDLKTRGDQALAKDVLRAQHAVNTNAHDPRQVIRDIRRKPLTPDEKKRSVYSVVLQTMRDNGEFLKTRNGIGWYIRRDVGRPIEVTPHSEALINMLDVQYGLNYTETEARFTAHGLHAYASSLPDNAVQAALSYYDSVHQHLLIHTGRETVYRVTADTIEKGTDGAYNVIFPWTSNIEQFVPVIRPQSAPVATLDWGEELFGNGTRGFGTSVENLINMPAPQAMALLKVWFMFVLFRNASGTKPILASLGQPGCIGKDTYIEIRRGEHSSKVLTIEEAYKKFHGIKTSGRAANVNAVTRIMSLKDGVIAWRKVHNIVRSGLKTTYTVTVQGRGSIHTTADHRFLTPYGYKHLEQLVVGDVVITRGDNLRGKGRTAISRPEVRAKYHPNARKRMVRHNGPYSFVTRARASVDAYINNMTLSDFLSVVNTDVEAASSLKYTPPEAHIHHLDENPYNDDPYNLQVMTKLKHDTLHGYSKVRNFGAWSGMYGTSAAPITSIQPYGVEDTYDIQMADEEAPNFVVNGLVLHNSGKTTLMRKIYAILYGRYKALVDLTNREEFDQATARDPLVVIDNVDTWEKWLPDRLATSAGVSDIERRKLYTDGGVYLVRRQAVLGVTAHNPKFGREDVADRFLLFSYKRFTHFESEDRILRDLANKRNEIWGAIIRDCQRVLATPVPNDDIPQFRIEDFARFGLWIARGLGPVTETNFRRSIEDVKTAQHAFTLEEEGLLVKAVTDYAVRSVNGSPVTKPEAVTAAQLWTQLEGYSGDPRGFANTYRNAVTLSKKLSAMQPALNRVVNIHQAVSSTGSRVWTITAKPPKD